MIDTGYRVVIDPSGVEAGVQRVNSAFMSMPDVLARSVSSIDSQLAKLRAHFFNFRTGLTALGIGEFVNSIIDAEVSFNKIINVLRVTTHDTALAKQEFFYVRDVANKLSLSLKDAALGYAKVAEASRGTSLEGEKARKIFEAIGVAVTASGGSSETLSNALLAVQEMISKGQVYTKELVRQLGNQLPGAFSIAARAMGVTTYELKDLMAKGLPVTTFLPKFAAQLMKELAPAAYAAGNSLVGLVNKFKTAIFEFEHAIGSGGFTHALTDALEILIVKLKTPDFQKVAHDIGDLLGSALRKATDAFMFLGSHISEAKTILETFIAIKAIEYFASLATTIKLVADNLMKMYVVQQLISNGQSALNIFRGTASSALNTPNFLAQASKVSPSSFSRNGAFLNAGQFASRLNNPAVDVEKAVAQYAALNVMLDRSGRLLNQGALNTRLQGAAFKALSAETQNTTLDFVKLAGMQTSLSVAFTVLGSSVGALLQKFLTLQGLKSIFSAGAAGSILAGLTAVKNMILATITGVVRLTTSLITLAYSNPFTAILATVVAIGVALYALRNQTVTLSQVFIDKEGKTSTIETSAKLKDYYKATWEYIKAGFQDVWDGVKKAAIAALAVEQYGPGTYVSWNEAGKTAGQSFLDGLAEKVGTTAKASGTLLFELLKKNSGLNALSLSAEAESGSGLKFPKANITVPSDAYQKVPVKPIVDPITTKLTAYDKLIKKLQDEVYFDKQLNDLSSLQVESIVNLGAATGEYNGELTRQSVLFKEIEAIRRVKEQMDGMDIKLTESQILKAEKLAAQGTKNKALAEENIQAYLTAIPRISDFNKQLDEQISYFDGLKQASAKGPKAVEDYKAAWEDANRVTAITEKLNAQQLAELKPWLDAMEKRLKMLRENVAAEKLAGEVAQANLANPGLAFKRFQQDTSRLKSSGQLDPVAEFSGRQNAIDAFNKSMDELLLKTKKAGAGAFVFFRQYAEAAKDAASLMEQVLSSAFNKIEDQLLSLLTKGKIQFKQFITEIRDDIARAFIKHEILGPLADWAKKHIPGMDKILGKHKPDGTQQDPIYVTMVDGSGVEVLNGDGTPMGGPSGDSNSGDSGSSTKNITSVFSSIEHGLLTGISKVLGTLKTVFTSVFNFLKENLSSILHGIVSVVSSILKAIKFADGGIMSPSSMARGGIGSGSLPKLAMFNETSLPEAFIPMPNRSSINVQFNRGRFSIPLPGGRSIPVTMNAAHWGGVGAYANGGIVGMYTPPQGNSYGKQVNVNVQHDGSTAIKVQHLSSGDIRIIAQQEAKRAVDEHGPNMVSNELQNPNSRSSKSLIRNVEIRRRR